MNQTVRHSARGATLGRWWQWAGALGLSLGSQWVVAQSLDATGQQRAAQDLAEMKRVRGVPFCADAELEQNLLQADGHRVQRRQLSRHCRDSEGRTRIEMQVAGQWRVFLHDPLTQERWLLDPQDKMAEKLQSPTADRSKDVSGWTKAKNRVRLWGQQLADWISGDGGPAAPAKGPAVEWPAPPTMQWMARGQGQSQALPGREIDGIQVVGELTTWSVTVRSEGSVVRERPIQISREVWTSPELGLTLASRDADPRQGETLYRMRNVVRTEPDPALFNVPADFKLRAPPPAQP